MNKFRTHSASYDTFALTDTQKEDMCVSLLNEFGAKIQSISKKGEILHSCPLPFNQHKNGDKNPSAFLNYKKLVFHCWGCGNSGSLLWFIATCRGESTEQSRGWLKTETSDDSLGSLLDYFDAIWSPDKEYKAPLPKLDKKILDPWLVIHPYMTEQREIDEETLMQFLVGYNPEVRCKVGEEWINSERIVIPHFWKGNLVGWQTRRLYKDGTPKYLSSPDFPKDSTIFNYNPKNSAFIVESPMSVLSQYYIHTNIEATFGASITDRQIRLLADHPRVILCFDNDEAGYNATREVGEELMKWTNVFVWDNPYNADMADMDPLTLDIVIHNKIPYSMWKPPEKLLCLN